MSLVLYPPAARLTILFSVELLSLTVSRRENLANSHILRVLVKIILIHRQASLQWQSEGSRDVCLPGLVCSKGIQTKQKSKIDATQQLFTYSHTCLLYCTGSN